MEILVLCSRTPCSSFDKNTCKGRFAIDMGISVNLCPLFFKGFLILKNQDKISSFQNKEKLDLSFRMHKESEDSLYFFCVKDHRKVVHFL